MSRRERSALTLEQLKSVPELAAERGIHVRTMRRQLVALHAQHGGKWLFRLGKKNFAVNLSLLLAQHPEVFKTPMASRLEVEELRDDVDALRKQHNALAYAVRKSRAGAHAHFTRNRPPPVAPTAERKESSGDGRDA